MMIESMIDLQLDPIKEKFERKCGDVDRILGWFKMAKCFGIHPTDLDFAYKKS